GASKVTGTWRGTWQAVRDMGRVLAERPAVPATATAQAQGGSGR
ncbi:glycosyltransferase, partial [Streptomyces sp. ActVer]|nr:glycosyltransferase [Streptomyces sp. ActVer]